MDEFPGYQAFQINNKLSGHSTSVACSQGIGASVVENLLNV
jgi:hypothetical protein